MPTSRILEIAEAIVTQVRALSGDSVEVTRIWFPRIDLQKPAEFVGRKAFVRAVSDEPTDPSQGGDRGHDPFLFRYALGFTERLHANLRTNEEKEAAIDCFVDWVTVIRDWFDESRDFELVDGVNLVPVETGVREAVDEALLNEHGVCYSEFTTAIREG